ERAASKHQRFGRNDAGRRPTAGDTWSFGRIESAGSALQPAVGNTVLGHQLLVRQLQQPPGRGALQTALHAASAAVGGGPEDRHPGRVPWLQLAHPWAHPYYLSWL